MSPKKCDKDIVFFNLIVLIWTGRHFWWCVQNYHLFIWLVLEFLIINTGRCLPCQPSCQKTIIYTNFNHTGRCNAVFKVLTILHVNCHARPNIFLSTSYLPNPKQIKVESMPPNVILGQKVQKKNKARQTSITDTSLPDLSWCLMFLLSCRHFFFLLFFLFCNCAVRKDLIKERTTMISHTQRQPMFEAKETILIHGPWPFVDG